MPIRIADATDAFWHAEEPDEKYYEAPQEKSHDDMQCEMCENYSSNLEIYEYGPKCKTIFV